MKIASWNVNSLRTRTEQVQKWLTENRPHILCLQETKCKDEHIDFEEFKALGYDVAHNGINHWNGVAVLSRVGIEKVSRNFLKRPRPPFDEPRFIRAKCQNLEIINVYVPNGRELDSPHYFYKLNWLKKLRFYLQKEKLNQKLTLVAGDFNVAPADFDVYDPIRWKNRTHTSPPEREAIARLCELGFVDSVRYLNPDSPQYSWWNYRANCFKKNFGLRIDLILASSRLTGKLNKCWVDLNARSAKSPSDHAPVVLEL